MQKRKAILTLLLVCGPVFISGCLLLAVGAAAAGTVAYVSGDLEAVEGKSLDEVYEATKKAMEQLELVVSEDDKDKTSALVIGRDSSDRRYKVKLARATENSTKISIRFGTIGNEEKSTMLYGKIKENLE